VARSSTCFPFAVDFSADEIFLWFSSGLIFATSVFALPLALAVFPQRQTISAKSLEPEFWERGGKDGLVEFNRGI
jgi:hypothetical protein